MSSPTNNTKDEANRGDTPEKDRPENYQGPHNWRNRLKPVKSPNRPEDAADHISEKNKERRGTREERYDENKVREKVRPAQTAKKELNFSVKSKVHVHPGSLSPAVNKRRHLSTTGESAFTRQVVNRPLSPGFVRKRSQQERKISAALAHQGRKSSINVPFSGGEPIQAAEAVKRRIGKVLKARLYLLQQTGPNSFLIGGDSPDHKYRVIIGPQGCSCGRGPHCVHILFVMLRVFQVSESDPCLWSKTLKNYEVETLFRNFYERRSSLITNLSKVKRQKSKLEIELEQSDDDEKQEQAEEERSNSTENTDECEAKEEEDTCPICLLEMVEGESLTECVNGCRNRLHHHCIDIWFEECRRQNEALNCPLCRAKWKQQAENNIHQVELPVPPNTRVSSPTLSQQGLSSPDRRRTSHHSIRHDEHSSDEITLPNVEPIAPEHVERAAQWIPILGEELVACFFSSDWIARETGLRQLGRVSIGALLLSAGEGRPGVHLSPTRQATRHAMFKCGCSVLAYMCADPVYKVYVAGLRTLRNFLAYTPCHDVIQQSHLQQMLAPVIDTILWKCADSNKRTSQLSMSALQEIVKGQDGELAVGKEIINPGEHGLGGISYLLECICQEYDQRNVQWQWLLGRMYMLTRLVDEYRPAFIIQPPHRNNNDDDTEELPLEQNLNYNRVRSVLAFCRTALTHSHTKVARLARRVFYNVGRSQAHSLEIHNFIVVQLEGVPSDLKVQILRRLTPVKSDFDVSLLNGTAAPANSSASTCQNVSMNGLSQDMIEPTESSISSCNSPEPGAHPRIIIPVNNFVSGNLNFLPMAPPNSPARRRMTSRKTSSAGHDDMASVSSESGSLRDPSTPSEDVSEEGVSKLVDFEVNLDPLKEEHDDKVTDNDASKLDESSSASAFMAVRGMPSGASASELQLDSTESEAETETSQLDVEVFDLFETPPPSNEKPAENNVPEEEEEEEDEVDGVNTYLNGYETPARHSEPDDVSECSGHATAASSSGTILSEELSDLTMSPAVPDVSFKTEVASGSPQHIPAREGSTRGSVDSDHKCHCKEEVEKEEAEALVEALEQSNTDQSVLPYVPGLSRESDTETLTIHIQDDEVDGQDHTANYIEGVQWRRGPMLGTGAFSTCYQARDIKTGALMCVKQISFCRNSESEQQLVIDTVREEIHMMSRLNHPNIIRILGATQHGCHFFMFVEWMPGGSLALLLSQYGPFTEAVLISYTQQVLRGLAYLHENHLLHRDLKGANLLVDSTGQRVRIGDFGAAARLASQQTAAGEFQGQLLGTIAFMAPEVLRGENYGRSCDVWGVGCVMLEMATTKPPWGASDVSNHLALIFKIASSVDPPPIPDSVSPPVRDLMLRCLECSRQDRPPARDLLKHPVFTMFCSPKR